mgnify:CR=1 FL=1
MEKMLLASLILASALACGGDESSAAGEIQVVVSIPPQVYFVSRIGGDRVRVSAILPPGASPAVYEPGPADMRMIAEADLYLAIGVPFEDAWLPRLESANPDLPVVATQQGIQRRHIQRHGTEAHDSHDHDGAPDPHIWLSPQLVRAQAETIARALIERDPGGESLYRANLESFQREIEGLQARLQEVLESSSAEAFVVFHPSWGYLADELGLVQLPIEVAGQEPSAAELAELVEYARQLEVPVVLVAPQFSRRTAETVAQEIGARVELADPLASDWPENLLEVTRKIAESR